MKFKQGINKPTDDYCLDYIEQTPYLEKKAFHTSTETLYFQSIPIIS
jgi:hypothetical protein